MKAERLDKLLAATGRWSRKDAKALLKAGRVRVDGAAPGGPEMKVPPEAMITVDGHPIRREETLCLMLHKPAGVVSSTEDPRDKTVLELLPEHLRRQGLFPVGRLDKETEGLLLLTNDGQLGHMLTSPARHVEKLYYAETDGDLTPADAEAFRAGIELKDGTLCRPAELEILDPPNHVLVTLREGKYHQVRRMLASRGCPVTYLKRLREGPLELDRGLPPGAWRRLTEEEIQTLKQACGYSAFSTILS